uniref:Chromosome 1 open reading frame 43 n=1 Tax=Oncorhynchus kisutch TaxID=8019 RepID=A0A8C7FKQ8_ONCKI
MSLLGHTPLDRLMSLMYRGLCLQVFVLLFIFVKRQIMRFAMKSRRGPHVPLGHNAPKELRQEIDSGLSKVQEIRFEPRLLSEQDDRLQSCYDYLYRMRALDAIRDSGKSSPCNSIASVPLLAPTWARTRNTSTTATLEAALPMQSKGNYSKSQSE